MLIKCNDFFKMFSSSDLVLSIAQNKKYLFYAKIQELPNQWWVRSTGDFAHNQSYSLLKSFSDMYI